ncbi:MAG: hypothetical protein H8E44_04345 [Planctomycetes bacterium]|nr:hypothetical protein [Planctomycetota bacterium]
MIRSKSDCRELIPRPSMVVVRQRITCLGWEITRYGDNLTLATAAEKRAISEADLIGLIWRNRKAINADIRLALG